MTAPAHPRFVVDASAVVALLADAGPAGTWVADTIRGGSLFAPELMPFEVANILRRHAFAGILNPSSAATLAHATWSRSLCSCTRTPRWPTGCGRCGTPSPRTTRRTWPSPNYSRPPW